jgi:hypothetical protein
MKEVAKYFIESPHAAEPGRECNFSHGHSRFVNELLGKKDAPGLCNRNGRSSKVLHEQSPELAAAYAKTFRQCFYASVVAIECAIGDERECAGNRVRSSAPRGQIGGGLRPATQAGAKAGLLCRRGRTKKPAILELRAACWTNRPAIDAGGRHTNEHQAVKTGITALESAIADLSIGQFHGVILSCAADADSRFSDMIARRLEPMLRL